MSSKLCSISGQVNIVVVHVINNVPCYPSYPVNWSIVDWIDCPKKIISETLKEKTSIIRNVHFGKLWIKTSIWYMWRFWSLQWSSTEHYQKGHLFFFLNYCKFTVLRNRKQHQNLWLSMSVHLHRQQNLRTPRNHLFLRGLQHYHYTLNFSCVRSMNALRRQRD